MAYYVTIHRGPRADQSVPILAISDPLTVDAILLAARHILDDARGGALAAPSEPTPEQSAATLAR